MDIRAKIDNTTEIFIPDGECRIIPTGIYMQIPVGFECQIRSRSGLAADENIFVLNSPGTIDSDYRGEIKVILMNLGGLTYEIQNGDRIAQLVFNKIEQPQFDLVESLESTERGEGGFGSTGIR